MSDEGDTTETACAVSPAYERLAASIARLVTLFQSRDLWQEVRQLSLVDPVHYNGLTVSSADVRVIEILAEHSRPIPRTSMDAHDVPALPRLARMGLVALAGSMVEITPRGRALGAFRQRQRRKSLTEAKKMRDWAMDLELRGS